MNGSVTLNSRMVEIFTVLLDFSNLSVNQFKRRTFSTDKRKYEFASVMVVHCTNSRTVINRSLANASFEGFLWSKKTRLIIVLIFRFLFWTISRFFIFVFLGLNALWVSLSVCKCWNLFVCFLHLVAESKSDIYVVSYKKPWKKLLKVILWLDFDYDVLI